MDAKDSVELVPYVPSEEVSQAVKGLCQNIKETLLLPSDTWGQGKSVKFYLKFQVVPESITVKIQQD